MYLWSLISRLKKLEQNQNNGGGGYDWASTLITLSASGWSVGKTQTVAVLGVSSSSDLIIVPKGERTNLSNYSDSGIIALDPPGTNSITFECETIPDSNIDIVILKKVTS